MNVGLMFLEESVERTTDSLCGLALNKPIHLPNVDVTKSELERGYSQTVGKVDANGTARVHLYDHFGSTNVESIVRQIEFFARARDCKFIVLDHISIVVSDQRNLDERRAIDELVTALRTAVQRLDICLLVVSHARRPGSGDKGHEDGAQTHLADLRGSAAIGQLSDAVIGLERNLQDENEDKRGVTRIRVLKNRFSGFVGPATYLRYQKDTGRMVEMSNKEYEALFGDGNSKPLSQPNLEALFKQFDTPVFENLTEIAE